MKDEKHEAGRPAYMRNTMVSKQLVDYFLVYSCKPKRRSNDQNEKSSSRNIGHHDDEKKNDGTPDRQKRADESPVLDRRASTRAVHFTVASDAGIVGKKKSEGEGVKGIEESGGDVTPLVAEMKRNENTLGLDPSSSGDITLAPSLRGIRIPATNDSAVFSESDDDDCFGDDICIKESQPGTPPRKGENYFDGSMTPSRVRAMDSDSEGEQTVESNRKGESYTSAKSPSRLRAIDVGSEEDPEFIPQQRSELPASTRSENIHLPTNNSTDSEKSIASEFSLEPIKTAQYPLNDREDCPLNPMVSHFCFPRVLTLTTEYQMPRIHYFVLTNDKGKKMYGTCLTVWETFDEDSDEEMRETLSAFLEGKTRINNASIDQDVEVSLSTKTTEVYIPKVLCILSSWPYLHSFREYLAQLYRLATMTDLMEVPIERYVMNICDEAPAPPPGIFELQLKIFSSTLKFWAPPGGQPLAYVALPFKVLFECLDLNNVVFVWYALTLERKVLLVSSKCSLVTTCAEILCSLLFPMEWSHLYIPSLPRFLSPMLDAPMPYLCGISRENLAHAIGDISDDTIVVDLDQNLITMGNNTESFPPLPLKRRSKLEKALEKNVGNIFWEARGLRRADILDQDGQVLKSDHLMRTADGVWKERLHGYDDVFNLAFTPNSETLLNGESRGYLSEVEGEFKQSSWDSVQEAFFRFYVTMLRDYKKYITVRKGQKTFKTKEFISSQKTDHRFFLREFCATQQFDCFLTKRMFEPGAPDVLFFDQSITAKRNRSKMTFKKKETPFLLSAKAHKGLRSVEVPQPKNEFGMGSNLMDQLYAATITTKRYVYKNWPETFDANLFVEPKPIPAPIAAEFARIEDASGAHFGQNNEHGDDFSPGNSHSSIEVATFTVFFVVYCKVVGEKFELLRNQYRETQPRREELALKIQRSVEIEIRESSVKSRVPDCATNICSPCSGNTVSKTTVTAERMAMLQPLHGSPSSMNPDESLEIDADVEAAQLIANRQLDLAFSVMETAALRNLPADQDTLKALMEACGRCGSTSRATQLMTMMKEQYLTVDSEIYSNYLTTFSVANEINPDEPIKSPLTNVPLRVFDPSAIKVEYSKPKWFNRGGKANRPRLTSSEHTNSFETNSNSETSSVSARSESSGTFKYRKSVGNSLHKKSQPKKKLLTTDTIQINLIMGECLLKDDLYSGIEIEDKGDSCPKCSAFLSLEELMMGWSVCHFNEYTTRCPHCKNSFIPRFIVKSRSFDFVGSHGPGSQLFCEFFSPWVLRRELFLATSGGDDMDAILDPRRRSGNDFNTKLWWNMVVLFRNLKLPFTFLFQGYFPGNLTV